MPKSNLVTFAFVWDKVKWLSTGPIEPKLHMDPLWDGGTKVSLNGPVHMTKKAAMPIYDKNTSKIFISGTSGPIALKLAK